MDLTYYYLIASSSIHNIFFGELLSGCYQIQIKVRARKYYSLA